MPWMGMGYVTLQEQVTFSSPGGIKLHRLMSTCACGAKFEFNILGPTDQKTRELASALGKITEHWLEHLK